MGVQCEHNFARWRFRRSTPPRDQSPKTQEHRRGDSMRYAIRCGMPVLVALPLISCSSGTVTKLDEESVPSSSIHQREASEVNLRTTWDEGAAGLESATGTFVRAAFESDFRVWISGDFAESFPGYKAALGDADVLKTYKRGGGLELEYSYSLRLKISRIEQHSATTATARVCTVDRTRLPAPSNEVTESGPRMVFLRFERTGDEPSSNQSGPAEVPSTNVFGGWKIDKIERTWVDGDPTKPNPRQECGPMALPPDSGPSRPGWPAPAGS